MRTDQAYAKLMPNLSRDEIKARIADGSIFAISIDTAIFDGLQGQFDNAVLKRLDQFHARDVRVVFSEIVAREIKRHVALAAKETQRALNKALRRHTNRWKLPAPDDAGDPLAIKADADVLAAAQFDGFLETVKGEIAPATGNPELSADVLSRYFSEAPPFGESDKRKHEFPDAFALLSLEALARDEGRFMLCVAPDKGWQDFASQSEHLICVKDLEDALSYFNDAGATAAVIALVCLPREAPVGLLSQVVQVDLVHHGSDGCLDFVALRLGVEAVGHPDDAEAAVIEPPHELLQLYLVAR